MSMIVDRLPYKVVIKGKKYKINVDYRYMLKFERIMQDESIDDGEKVANALMLFYPAFFEIMDKGKEAIEEAIDKLLWFYKRGREQENYNVNKVKISSKRPVYSYELDDEYIFGAFWHDYRIDLSKDKLHWWKFKALELSLTEQNEFVKIKGYRSYNGDNKDLLYLKDVWKLPLPKNIIEETDKIAELLMKKGE